MVKVDEGKLKDLEIRRETRKGMYPDGGGLYLQVTNKDAKSWLFRYSVDGRERRMGLGSFNTVTLNEAREEARECRKLRLKGIDPIEHREAQQLDQHLARAKEKTFRECAEGWFEANRVKWEPPTVKVYKRRLENHIYPKLGDLPVQKFDMRSPTSSAVQILDDLLHPMWRPTTRAAEAVQQMIESILAYAIAKQYIAGDNAASLKGPLGQLLPKVSTFYVVEHFKSLPYTQIGKFMKDLRSSTGFNGANGYCPICASPHRAEIEAARRADNGVVGLRSHPSETSYNTIAARFGVHAGSIWRHLHRGHEQRPPMTYMKRPKSTYAAEFVILTGVRKGQALAAEWTEIDWENRLLTSPWRKASGEQGHKTGKKTKGDYVTPLSDDAMDVLRTMKKWQEDNGINSKFVFSSEGNPHGRKSSGHIRHHTINAFMQRSLNYPGITIHGFRATFSTWATEHDYDEIDIEMQLGHVVGSAVRNAYKRDANRIEQRRLMMQAWADYCRAEPLPTDDVIQLLSAELNYETDRIARRTDAAAGDDPEGRDDDRQGSYIHLRRPWRRQDQGSQVR